MGAVSDRKKTICVDFDGVIHGYQSGWQGADKCPDPPVPGAIEWLRKLMTDPGLRVDIYSSRSKDPGGILAMASWLERNGLATEEVLQLGFPTQKPAAYLTIDDRAWCFTGDFPTTEQIHGFRTWQQ